MKSTKNSASFDNHKAHIEREKNWSLMTSAMKVDFELNVRGMR
jgi:hypothetical protein